MIESIKEPVFKIPGRKKLADLEGDGRKQKKVVYEEQARRNALCICCDGFIPWNLLYDLSYSQIIQVHRRRDTTKANSVPPIVEKVYPGITLEKFSRLKADTKWLKETVKVCETCYLFLTDQYVIHYNSLNHIITLEY